MARLRFCGFDYQAVLGASNTSSFAFPTGNDLDKDCVYVSRSSDTTFFAPWQSNPTFISVGRTAGSNALGYQFYLPNNNLGAMGGSWGCAVPTSAIGSPSEIWVTFDIQHYTYENIDNPASLMRSEARYQVFKFGDLSLRVRRVTNYVTVSGINMADFTFEAFNGVTSLGTIVVPAYAISSWMFVRIYAKLDSVSGRMDVTIDGQAASYTGLNSVATTPLASVTHMYFSGGALGLASGSGQIMVGAIDNLLLDSTNFPVGRPRGQRVSIASDGTLSGWASTSGGTITSALSVSDSSLARGTGAGSTALLNLTAPSTTGLNGVLGWQIHAYGVSNVDAIAYKKLRTGVDISGTVTNGTYIVAQVPPATPAALFPGIDTMFYSSGTTDFTLASVANTKLRLEVV